MSPLVALLSSLLLVAAPPPPPAAAPATPTVLALVIGNNQGLALGRPTLQYSDDDAAKYYQLFTQLTQAGHVALLTELDRDTERLFPPLVRVASAPTRANVLAAAARLALQAREERAQGRRVELYFVFAGHGDVDQGRGFLELKDASFHSEDLESLLRQVDANRSHVILDSCNSFFVLNPRKPGGRRFATPQDAAESLSRRLPNVGVFLSTSAEAETFEWSELQSGIFSHAVRSGLLGAADANGDGKVSYEELQAFVETATQSIKNPTFRPKVFARGPEGKGDSALLDLSASTGPTVSVDTREALRLTLRDASGLPWLDAYKEEGTVLRVHLPARLAEGFTLEREEVVAGVSRVTGRYPLGSGPGQVLLSSLRPIAVSAQGRGPGELFQVLFSDPFGPHALLAYEQLKAREPPAVYGVSSQDMQRMGLLLERLKSAQRARRYEILATFGAVSTGALVLGGINLGESRGDRTIGTMATVTGAAFGLVDLFFLHSSAGERLKDTFSARLARGVSSEVVVADTEAQLELEYLKEQDSRGRDRVVGWLVFGAGVSMTVGVERLIPPVRSGNVAAHLLGPALLSVGLYNLVRAYLGESPTESVLRVWRDDPARISAPRLSLGLMPGGGQVQVSGSF